MKTKSFIAVPSSIVCGGELVIQVTARYGASPERVAALALLLAELASDVTEEALAESHRIKEMYKVMAAKGRYDSEVDVLAPLPERT